MTYLLLFIFSVSLNAAKHTTDPYANTDYEKVFSRAVYEDIATTHIEEGDSASAKVSLIFQKKLNKEKNKSAFKPVIHAGIDCLTKAACVIGLVKLWGNQEISTAYEILVGALTGVGFSNLAKCSMVYIDPSRDNIKRWEDEFIQKLHIIQPNLWPKITDNFEKARRGVLSKDEYEQFFNAALNLPKRKFVTANAFEEFMNDKLQEINTFTSNFLSDYEGNETIQRAELMLKACTRQYLSAESVVSLHMVSQSGTGKHHYLKDLALRISQLYDDFSPELIEINDCKSSSDLLGTKNMPGSLLKAISNLSRQNRPRGIIVINSSTEKFSPEIIKTAETIFSDDIFKPDYLQRDGFNDVEITIKGFFFVLMSQNIDDAQHRSKIDTIAFPDKLKPDAVKSHLEQCLKRSFTTGRGITPEEIIESEEFNKAIISAKTISAGKVSLSMAIEQIHHRKNSLLIN